MIMHEFRIFWDAFTHMGLESRKPVSGFANNKDQAALASVQSANCLCCLLIRKYYI